MVTFGIFTFRLTETSVAKALVSCLGGFADGFRVHRLYDYGFRFSVTSKYVGFLVYSMTKYDSKDFTMYFHLWRDGAPNWKWEFSRWKRESDNECSLHEEIIQGSFGTRKS